MLQREYTSDCMDKRNQMCIRDSFKGGHYAAYPPKLVETCLLAVCPEGGIVRDPLMGSCTTGMVAAQIGRHFVGIELNQMCIRDSTNTTKKPKATPAGTFNMRMGNTTYVIGVHFSKTSKDLSLIHI